MKAILVIDVPTLDDGRHLCNECPIWNNERLFCQYVFNMKTKGCPLKPLPKKKLVLEHIVDGNRANDSVVAKAHGYNKCIEEIDE